MITPGIFASIMDINGPDARKFAERNTIYVSLTGKDGYLGATPNLPTKTLAGVKAVIIKLKQGNAKNIKVEFKAGSYKAEEFFFNDDNKLEFLKDTEGGNSTYNLTFKPYNNNNVVFDNSKTYTGFTSAGSLWKMEINPFDMRKLNMFGFVNDVRTIPARWPKYGVSIDDKVINSYYRKAVDSTGFLQSIYSYQTAGGDMRKIGVMGILDYREFIQEYLPAITTSLPGYNRQPNVFYIRYNRSPNLQIFANQSTIKTPRIQYSNWTDPAYYIPVKDITYQMLSASPLLVLDSFGLTIPEYIVSEYYTSDSTEWTEGTKIEEFYYTDYLINTSLSSLVVYVPPVTTLSGFNWWYQDMGQAMPLMPEYLYEPSNLDPYIVCSVEGENTIISEDSKYYFYYKPTQDDQIAGINNCILKTYNVGSDITWYGRYGINNVNKYSSGIQYGIVPDKYSAYSSGFCIVNPNYTTFEDLTFKYCVAPLTLVTPISTDYSANGWDQQSDAIRQYSTNLTITGCKLYNSFSVGIQINSTSKSRIEKNLIYSTEAAGISYRDGGHDIVLKNNIIKNSQQIDTRLNGDNRGSPGNIQIDGSYYSGHQSRSLTGVQISNNDFSFAGTNLIASVCQDMSAYSNKVYNSGFGTNSDMACVYSGFSFPPEDKFNYFINNLIYNSRNDGNFLASGIYIDGGSRNAQIDNNIISKMHTGIEYSNTSNGRVVNNIVYDTKQIGFFQGVALTKSSYVQNNIIVPGIYKDSNYIDGRTYMSIRGYYGWFGSSHVNRIQSYTNIAILNCTDDYTKPYYLYPAFSWNGKLKYVALAGGGASSIEGAPILFFNGDNWVVADYNGTTALYPYISSTNTSIYDNPWDIPESSWINLSSGYLKDQRYFKKFKNITKSNNTHGISTPAISGDNNLFWSLMPTSTHPESDSIFFNISEKTFENRLFYSTLSSISSVYCDDSSRPDIFANYIKPIDVHSKLADPLFIDPENLDFGLNPNSPAYDIGFQNIDTSNIGVYNTGTDPTWVELANTLKPQPVIFGNTNWADFETIPYPYNPNVEYYTNNNPILNELNDLRTLTPWTIGKTTVVIISSNPQGISDIFNFSRTSTVTDDSINVIKPNNYILNGVWTTNTTAGRWIRQTTTSINVSMFGAVGDGVTDDQPAIQAAIDYCSNNGIETLYFNSGVYYLSSTATGTGTPVANTNGVGYGAGENLNIGFYPEPLSAISYSTMYNNINYKPTNPKKINLSLIGTGSTILSARKEDRVTRFGGQASIIALRENINNFKMKGLSLLWDGYLTGQENFQSQGVIIASNYGGAMYGRSVFWPIDRNKIDIVDCTFINCNRAISSASSILSGRGTNTVNITGCNFLYPKGSDSTRTDGGSQVLLFDYDTLNLNITDNFAEGTTTIPVRSPNYKAKDGFITYGGVNNRYERNTMARFDIEAIIASAMSPGVYCLSGSRVPYVGGTIALTAADVRKDPGGGNYSCLSVLTAYQGFNIGDIISYNYNAKANATCGVYRIDNLIEKASTSSYEIRATRLSGANYGGEFANLRVAAVGYQLSSGNFITPLNLQDKISNKTYVLDNTFTAGIALSSPTSIVYSHQPAVRSDAGYVYLSGNTIPALWAFYGNGQTGQDFKSEWVIENNTFYCCSSATTLDLGNLNTYNSTIKNNDFYFWSDFNNNNALVYTAPRKASSGSVWNGVGINWGHQGLKEAYALGADVGRQVVVDNRFYCTYPLSAATINTVAGTTKFDIVSGNTISNIVNVSQFGAVGDGVTDDQPAIQAAIDYCSNNGIENLLFDSKTYYLSSSKANSNTIQNIMSSNPSLWANNEVPYYLSSSFYTGLLLVGFNPLSPAYFKLNFIGKDSTKFLVKEPQATRGGILSLRSNLTASTISDITFEFDYLSAGYPEYNASGIFLGGYSPTQPNLTYYTDNINRNITIKNNDFINCHSAIDSSGYTNLSTSIFTLEVLNNNFYAPRGGDTGSGPMSPGNLGGTIITGKFNNFICKNNFAEGTTYLPVRGYSPIDGFILGEWNTCTIENNHLTRFGVEGIVNVHNKNSIYINQTITIPATGAQITIRFNNLNYSNQTNSQWRKFVEYSFPPGKIVTFLSPQRGGRDGSAGKYRVDSYDTTTIPGSCTFTRLSSSPWEMQSEFISLTAGQSVPMTFIQEYNPTDLYNISHTIKNNLFEAADPSIRLTTGNSIIEGNTFYQHSSSIDNGILYGTNILLTLAPNDPYRKDIIRNNTFYIRGFGPPATNISIATYKPEIYNNTFNYTFGPDNISLTAARDIPQLYINTSDGITPSNPTLGFNPVFYRGIYGYGTDNRYLSAYNNTFNFYIPLSVQNMFCYYGDSTDTYKGNNINVYNVLSAQSLRQVYNQTFNNNFAYNAAYSTTVSAQNIYAYVDTDTFTFNPTSVAADNNVTIFKPNAVGSNSGRWISTTSINVSQFGAVGDGVTDDQPAIQAAIDYCSNNNIETLYFNSGTYFLSAVAWTDSNQYYKPYPREYLQVGYTPILTGKPKVKLTIKGTGNTILSASTDTRPFRDGHYTIIGLREHIDTFKMKGMTLLWDGGQNGTWTMPGAEFHHGITVLSDLQFAAVDHPININKIELIDNTFINCHRAIHADHTCNIPGSGVNVFNIYNNRFLYPKGGDTIIEQTPNGNSGTGFQVTLFSTDINHLNIVGNYAEGTSVVPVNSPNLHCVDGMVTYTGLNTYIANNVFERFSIETIVASPMFRAISTAEPLTIPPVGSQVTLSATNALYDGYMRSDWQKMTAHDFFKVGSIIANDDNDIVGGGVYRVDSYNRVTSNTLNITMTRLSGTQYGTELTSYVTKPVGTKVSNVFIPFNADKIYGANTKIVDNIFAPGNSQILATSGLDGFPPPLNTIRSHDPAIRIDSGYHYISGNKFYAIKGLMMNSRIASPYTDATVEFNDFYIYDRIGLPAEQYSAYFAYTANYTCLSTGIIRNNNFHYWVNTSGNISLTANQLYFYGEFSLHGNNGDLGNNQVFINNTTYCYAPTLSYLLTAHAHNGYRTPSYNNGNSHDIITGNTLINVY